MAIGDIGADDLALLEKKQDNQNSETSAKERCYASCMRLMD